MFAALLAYRNLFIPFAVVLLVLALWLSGDYHGRQVEKGYWIKQQQADAALVAAQEAKNAQALAHALDVNRQIEDKYAQAQADAHTANQRLADSLRRYAALSARTVSSEAPAASGSNDAPVESTGIDGFTGVVGRLSEACRSDADKLSALQQWARSQ